MSNQLGLFSLLLMWAWIKIFNGVLEHLGEEKVEREKFWGWRTTYDVELAIGFHLGPYDCNWRECRHMAIEKKQKDCRCPNKSWAVCRWECMSKHLMCSSEHNNSKCSSKPFSLLFFQTRPYAFSSTLTHGIQGTITSSTHNSLLILSFLVFWFGNLFKNWISLVKRSCLKVIEIECPSSLEAQG